MKRPLLLARVRGEMNCEILQKVMVPVLRISLILVVTLSGPKYAKAQSLAPLYDAGDPVSAIELDEPTLTAARGLREVLPALEAEDPDRAQRALERAEGLVGIDDYLEWLSAKIALAKGDLDLALALAELGQSRFADSPLRAAFLETYADILQKRGSEASAREAWQRAIAFLEDGDTKAELWYRTGQSYESEGQLAAAMAAYQQASNAYPTTPAGLQSEERLQSLASQLNLPARTSEMALERGNRFLANGWSDSARLAFEEALSGPLTKPQLEQAQMQLGIAFFYMRHYDESAETFAKRKPDQEATYWWARAQARRGEVTTAISTLESLAKRAPPVLSSRSLLVAALLLQDRGEARRALALFERIAKNRRAPEQASAAFWRLGWARFRAGQYQRARKEFLAMAKRSNDPLDRLRPLYWGARAAEESGAIETAQREFIEIASQFPFSYYGWRASQRIEGTIVRPNPVVRVEPHEPANNALRPAELERIAVLLEAGLEQWAQDELAQVARRARSLDDRIALASLYTHAGDYHTAQRLIVDAYANLLASGVDPQKLKLWQLAWPMAYGSTLREVFSTDFIIDPELVLAIMREESGYRPGVISSAGARGLLQIMPETGARLARRAEMDAFADDDLFSPKVNIALGSLYLDELWRRFGGRASAAIGSYNAGPEPVSRWLKNAPGLDDDVFVEQIPYSQTQAYVKRVLRSLHVYKTFY